MALWAVLSDLVGTTLWTGSHTAVHGVWPIRCIWFLVRRSLSPAVAHGASRWTEYPSWILNHPSLRVLPCRALLNIFCEKKVPIVRNAFCAFGLTERLRGQGAFFILENTKNGTF